MNGDLPSMAGYYDPPDHPEPKETEVTLSLLDIIECGEESEFLSLLQGEAEGGEVTGYRTIGHQSHDGADDAITFRVWYHPLDDGPDPDAGYDAMRDEG